MLEKQPLELEITENNRADQMPRSEANERSESKARHAIVSKYLKTEIIVSSADFRMKFL